MQLITTKDIVDVIKYVIVDENEKTKSQRMPNDAELSRELEFRNVYETPLVLHCLFDKYENQFITNPVETMNYQIEHIMPRDGVKWYDIVNLSKEEYDLHKNRLGNLTLTTKHDNPQMSNNLFEYKKIILENTAGFRLNSDIYTLNKWDLEEINKRNEKLIQAIIKLYPYTPSLNKTKYDGIMESARKLPNMQKLIEWGLVNKGDELYLKGLKEESVAILEDEGHVKFDGEIISLNQWYLKIYGRRIAVNFYKEIYLVLSNDSLDNIRKEFIKQHPEMSTEDDSGYFYYRNVLAEKIKDVLKEYDNITLLPSGSVYIRFAGIKSREKVGLYGDKTWSGIQDLIAYELYNIKEGVGLSLFIGPSENKILRQKWHDYAKTCSDLGGKYKEICKKWDPMIKAIKIADSRDKYLSDEDYYNIVINNLRDFLNNKFPILENAIVNADISTN